MIDDIECDSCKTDVCLVLEKVPDRLTWGAPGDYYDCCICRDAEALCVQCEATDIYVAVTY